MRTPLDVARVVDDENLGNPCVTGDLVNALEQRANRGVDVFDHPGPRADPRSWGR